MFKPLRFRTNPTQSGQLLPESLFFRTNPAQPGPLLAEGFFLQNKPDPVGAAPAGESITPERRIILNSQFSILNCQFDFGGKGTLY